MNKCIILFVIIIFILLFLLYYKKYSYSNNIENFSLELKHNVVIVIYPNIDENNTKKVLKMCKSKFKQCNKIKIIYDTSLDYKKEIKTKYIVVYNSEDRKINNNNNNNNKYYNNFKKKWIKKNKKYYIIDYKDIKTTYKHHIKKILLFLDLDINFSNNNLSLLSLLI